MTTKSTGFATADSRLLSPLLELRGDKVLIVPQLHPHVINHMEEQTGLTRDQMVWDFTETATPADLDRLIEKLRDLHYHHPDEIEVKRKEYLRGKKVDPTKYW